MRTAPTTGSFQDSDTPVITVTLQEIRNCEAASWATCDYCGSVLSMLIDGGGKKIKRRRGCNPQHRKIHSSQTIVQDFTTVLLILSFQ
ncbi:hypothetical protein MTP99_010032 [Tenebrio molitor]|uniref:Uncharacterized protein n=1 Tax=Tenebrio molitor TaxID=7067 RepID=A0A8J6HLH6_TENMO|nr:hypothetical protein GEV33_005945 [Tenebrio molitor]KAJ3633059.1 hypothetical protein MTP99_010032 [Tenebrio molitor]